MSDRPNILFITSDQQRADCYGFAGRRVKTPHLDRLAAEGTHFDACITPNLVCQPSRASMLTGLLPLTHGVADNGIDLRPEVGERGFATALGAPGLRHGLHRQGAFRDQQHLRADRHAGMQPQHGRFRPVLVRALYGLQPCRADGARALVPPSQGGVHTAERAAFRALGVRGVRLSRHIRPLGGGDAAGHGRGADLEFRHAGCGAQQRLVRGPHDRVAAEPEGGHALLRVGLVPGPAPSLRLPGALEPAAPSGRGGTAGRGREGPRPPPLVAPRLAGARTGARRPEPQGFPRQALARAGPGRRRSCAR